MVLLKILITIILILLNAFFVLVEFALITIRSSRVEELIRKGNRRAKLVKFALKHIDDYLAAVQLGITMTSLGVGWIGEPVVAQLIYQILPDIPLLVSKALSYTISFAIAFVFITSLHILFGEQLPKLIAIKMPEKMIFPTVLPMTFIYYVSYVPMLILNKLAQFFLKIFKIKPEQSLHILSNEEIKILLNRSEEAGKLSLDQLVMFENLFDFGNTKVKDAMTPREKIAYLSLSKPWKDNLEIIKNRKYSKYPLCENELDSVIGYIHLKDLVLLPQPENQNPDLKKIKKDILQFHPEDRLEYCLRCLQDNTQNMAIVISDDNKIVGIITVEDVIEEIVGEIRDGYEERPMIPLSDIIITDSLLFDVTAEDRFTAIKTILANLHLCRPLFSLDEANTLLIEREKKFTSGVGSSLALPHARIPSLKNALLTFARVSEGIDFLAPDNLPVRLIFLFLTPLEKTTIHLQILSQLSRLLSNPTLKSRFLTAKNSNEVMEIIRSFEGKIPI
ncbi:MAG: CNNM domain-containing protein [Candidatus Hydrogenedentota bacterium]